MNIFWLRRAYFLAALLLLPIQGCAAAPQFLPITGQVIEEGTNKPLPGVIVVGHWLGTVSGFGGHGGTVCRHVETATTDNQGRYRLSLWEDRGPTVVYSYKTGYQASEGRGRLRTVERVLEILKPFAGTKSERLEYLRRIGSAVGCPNAGESGVNLLDLRRGLLAEAEKLIDSNRRQEEMEAFLLPLEIIEFGYEAAELRQIARLRVKK